MRKRGAHRGGGPVQEQKVLLAFSVGYPKKSVQKSEHKLARKKKGEGFFSTEEG